ncbi:F-box/LRR-repeat protein 20-like [Dreissena polymorpha]|uniref:F-box/LRR-repeat protein 20-like n=1 Tax=Dreissena polymorpha TaxID=45954 RepID=UPI0022647F5D|nr:F-box/LRR-repeat protein 20-like [Dreissena polymorpha]
MSGGVLSLVKLQSAHLRELKLHGAEITDASLYGISQCRDLRCLEISSCKRLTDQSLQYLKNCHNLEHLRLNNDSDFTKAGLSAFFKSGTLAHLHTLDLNKCIAIDDNMVLDIVQCYGPCLCKLSLRLCSNISDRGLASIMDHCCELTHLDLMDNDHILGERLERIPEDLPKLRNLNIQYCKRIVESIIEDLERRKPNLFDRYIQYVNLIPCFIRERQGDESSR